MPAQVLPPFYLLFICSLRRRAEYESSTCATFSFLSASFAELLPPPPLTRRQGQRSDYLTSEWRLRQLMSGSLKTHVPQPIARPRRQGNPLSRRTRSLSRRCCISAIDGADFSVAVGVEGRHLVKTGNLGIPPTSPEVFAAAANEVTTGPPALYRPLGRHSWLAGGRGLPSPAAPSRQHDDPPLNLLQKSAYAKWHFLGGRIDFPIRVAASAPELSTSFLRVEWGIWKQRHGGEMTCLPDAFLFFFFPFLAAASSSVGSF